METGSGDIKQTLLNSKHPLRSKKPKVVKELWAILLGYKLTMYHMVKMPQTIESLQRNQLSFTPC